MTLSLLLHALLEESFYLLRLSVYYYFRTSEENNSVGIYQ